MTLLDKLKTQGSTLTDVDGNTPKKYSGNFEIVYNFKCDKVKSHFDKDTVSKIIFLFHSIPKWKTKIRIIQGNFVILK